MGKTLVQLYYNLQRLERERCRPKAKKQLWKLLPCNLDRSIRNSAAKKLKRRWPWPWKHRQGIPNRPDKGEHINTESHTAHLQHNTTQHTGSLYNLKITQPSALLTCVQLSRVQTIACSMIMCLGKREVSPQTPPVEIPQAYSYSPHPNIAVLQCTSHIPQSGPTLACTTSHCIQLAFSL